MYQITVQIIGTRHPACNPSSFPIRADPTQLGLTGPESYWTDQEAALYPLQRRYGKPLAETLLAVGLSWQSRVFSIETLTASYVGECRTAGNWCRIWMRRQRRYSIWRCCSESTPSLRKFSSPHHMSPSTNLTSIIANGYVSAYALLIESDEYRLGNLDWGWILVGRVVRMWKVPFL